MKKLFFTLALAVAFSSVALADSQYTPGASVPGTTINTGCQATGGAIVIPPGSTQTVQISTEETPVSLTGSGQSILGSNCGNLLNLSGASAENIAIGGAGTTGFPVGWFVKICNNGTADWTIIPGAGTINGAASYVVSQAFFVPTCVDLIANASSDYTVIFSGRNFGSPSGGSIAAGVIVNCPPCSDMRFVMSGDYIARMDYLGLHLESVILDENYSYQTPSTGNTVSFPNNTYDLILQPASTLATLTITTPPNPHDGQIAYIHSTQTVSALTISSGSSGTVSCPATIGAGSSLRLFFYGTSNLWIC